MRVVAPRFVEPRDRLGNTAVGRYLIDGAVNQVGRKDNGACPPPNFLREPRMYCRGRGGPRSTATFFSLPRAKNASHCPSGDQNGSLANSVPGMARNSGEPSRRTNNRRPFAPLPTNAIDVPSGDTVGGD